MTPKAEVKSDTKVFPYVEMDLLDCKGFNADRFDKAVFSATNMQHFEEGHPCQAHFVIADDKMYIVPSTSPNIEYVSLDTFNMQHPSMSVNAANVQAYGVIQIEKIHKGIIRALFPSKDMAETGPFSREKANQYLRGKFTVYTDNQNSHSFTIVF